MNNIYLNYFYGVQGNGGTSLDIISKYWKRFSWDRILRIAILLKLNASFEPDFNILTWHQLHFLDFLLMNDNEPSRNDQKRSIYSIWCPLGRLLLNDKTNLKVHYITKLKKQDLFDHGTAPWTTAIGPPTSATSSLVPFCRRSLEAEGP